MIINVLETGVGIHPSVSHFFFKCRLEWFGWRQSVSRLPYVTICHDMPRSCQHEVDALLQAWANLPSAMFQHRTFETSINLSVHHCPSNSIYFRLDLAMADSFLVPEDNEMPNEEFDRLMAQAMQLAQDHDNRSLLRSLLRLTGRQKESMLQALEGEPSPVTPPISSEAAGASRAAAAPPAVALPAATPAHHAPANTPPDWYQELLTVGLAGQPRYAGLWMGDGYQDVEYVRNGASTIVWTRAVKCVTCEGRAVAKKGVGQDPIAWLNNQGWYTPNTKSGKWKKARCPQCSVAAASGYGGY